MKITVLGNNGPFEGADKACSGYLVEHGKYKILMDCGNGVLSRLQKYCRIAEITHIILSHLHYDHFSDIMVLRYAVDIKKKRGSLNKDIELYLPKEPGYEFSKITDGGIFRESIIDENTEILLENLKISFKRTNHPVECYASKMEFDNKKIIYSGDAGITPGLAEFAYEAEMFICDTGLLEKDKTSSSAPHMTALEVGKTASEAKIKRLLLTHFWPEYDLNELLNEAKINYPEAELALEGKTYTI